MFIHGADGSPFVAVVTPPWIKNAENCSRTARVARIKAVIRHKRTQSSESNVCKNTHSWGINSYLNKTSITKNMVLYKKKCR